MNPELWNKITADPVATYAAGLSTILAIAALARATYHWFNDGPRAAVVLLVPASVRRMDRRFAEIIVSNIGDIPIVPWKIEIDFRSRRWLAAPTGKAVFDHSSGWDPSLENIEVPGKPGTTKKRTLVIRPGEESHHLLKVFDAYDASCHWLRVAVYLRNRRTAFITWAAPEDTRG